MPPVSIKFDFSQLHSRLQKTRKYFEGPAKVLLANNVIAQVKDFATRGLGADGNPMAPYKTNYAKLRIAHGLSGDTVTLRVYPKSLYGKKRKDERENSLLDTLFYDSQLSVITVDDKHAKILEGLSNKRKFLGANQKTIDTSQLQMVRDIENIH